MGSKVGFVWVYVLLVFFCIGIMELLLMPAITHKLVPSLLQSANSTLSAADTTAYTTQISTTIGFMHSAMYVVMVVVFIYAIVSVFKREETEMYQP